MVIQGTQVPMYTKQIVFVFFWFFKKKIYLKNKINKTEKQPNKNMLNKAKHKN